MKRIYSSYSNRARMWDKFNAMKVEERCRTFIEELPEEYKNKARKGIRMLERKTACIKKCELCGRIAILTIALMKYIPTGKWRNYWCQQCKHEKMPQYEEKPWLKEAMANSDRLQPIYKKVWEEYLRSINEGVTIYQQA